MNHMLHATFTTSANIESLLTIEYGYDSVGNITELMYSSDNLTESRVYEYDSLNRLGSVTIGGNLTETIAYSSTTGNIDSKDGVLYGYDVNHLHAVTTLDSVQKYSYDANGRW